MKEPRNSNCHVKWTFFVRKVDVAGFFFVFFSRSLVSLREGRVHCLSFGFVHVITYMHCKSKSFEVLKCGFSCFL
jgi:hypothetical protein